jgi:hypothetical protein
MRRPFVIAFACLAALTAMSACQSGQDPAVDITTTTPSTLPGQTTTTPTTIASGFGTSAVSIAPGKKGLLTAVRGASQSGFDRVVFEFEGSVPGYAVSYVNRPITEDGSGKTVEVKGDSVLQVRLEPASGADLAGDTVRETYTGPNRFTPNTSVVTELVRTGDFEAVLNWVIGVKGKPGFRVNTLSGPPRLVVEIAA